MIKYGIIIQARMASTRRPGKISFEILGRSLLFHQINRIKAQCNIPVIVATTNNTTDDWTSLACEEMGIPYFRGSEDDVMHRYLMAAKHFNVQNIIRVGGDDPLIDPNCILRIIEKHQEEGGDFVYASHRNGWIYGTAAELIPSTSLERAYKEVKEDSDKEHAVSYIRKNEFFKKVKVSPQNAKLIRPDIFFSVDYQEDLDLISEVLIKFNEVKKLYTFSQDDLIKLYDSGVIKITNRHLHEPFDED